MNLDPVIETAWRAYDREDYAGMVSYATRLVSAGDPWAVQGHFLRGMAHEHWEAGPDDRLQMAVSDYRSAAILAPHANAYQNLARALMKLGNEHYDEAHRFLLEAWSLKRNPELMLGFGKYFLTKPVPDPERALAFYRRAAMHGRFRGFVAAAQICRDTGKPFQGALWDATRVLLAPIIWLTQGRRAMFEF